MMKTTIISIACCALIAPLAFAKESKQKKLTTAYLEQGVTVTGRTITTVEGGTAASHQPAKTLIVNQNDPKDPSENQMWNLPSDQAAFWLKIAPIFTESAATFESVK